MGPALYPAKNKGNLASYLHMALYHKREMFCWGKVLRIASTYIGMPAQKFRGVVLALFEVLK